MDIKNRIIAGCLVAIISLFCLNKCNYDKYQAAKQDAVVKEQNIKALTDSVRITKTKIGTLEYDKYTLVADKNELKKINSDLANEVNITKDKVLTITKTKQVLVHDTLQIKVEQPVVQDGVVVINGQYDTTYSAGNFRKFKTTTEYNIKNNTAIQKIVNDSLGFTAITGLKINSKGDYEIFVRPNYPNLNVVSLEGAILDKNLFKPKSKAPKITIGAHLGWTPVIYNIQSKQATFSLYQVGVGVGINFNF